MTCQHLFAIFGMQCQHSCTGGYCKSCLRYLACRGVAHGPFGTLVAAPCSSCQRRKRENVRHLLYCTSNCNRQLSFTYTYTYTHTHPTHNVRVSQCRVIMVVPVRSLLRYTRICPRCERMSQLSKYSVLFRMASVSKAVKHVARSSKPTATHRPSAHFHRTSFQIWTQQTSYKRKCKRGILSTA